MTNLNYNNSNIHKLVIMNYRLTTAEILYHIPDFPDLLQSYIWQEFDLAPNFPILKKFLHFWQKELDGKLHSVKVENCEVIKPNNFRSIDREFNLY